MIAKKIAQIVEKACASKSNIYGYGIWPNHIVQVVKSGKNLAKVLGADVEIVEIAALLHDYASVKDSSMSKEHHIHSANDADALLRQLNYPQDRIERVKECIVSHRGSVPLEKESIEARCLADADAMAHIGQMESLLDLACNRHGMNLDDSVKWVRAKLKRSWNKLSPGTKILMTNKYDNALKTLEIISAMPNMLQANHRRKMNVALISVDKLASLDPVGAYDRVS